jgi:hypothetical protein
MRGGIGVNIKDIFMPRADGTHYIFRKYITGKDGRRIYASQFGLKAFPILVSDDEPKREVKPKAN